MAHSMSNQAIAELLRKVAAAYQITGENRFRIIAYERAADSVEHLTSEVKDLWDDGKLDEISGVGVSIATYLDELFKTGRVKHFDSVMAKVPQSIYPLLGVPGIGPKKAYKLVTALKLTKSKDIIGDLEKAVKAHKVAGIASFGEKSETDILESLEAFRRGQVKENRMTLPVADAIAGDITRFLKVNKHVLTVDVLGSLRRQVATIGDIDLSVATKHPADVIAHFLTYPHQKMIEKGPAGASLLLHNGRQVDMRIQDPGSYGAMLQYFTGSKNHNIKLRQLALDKGLSLNEYGIKHVKSGNMDTFPTEKAFYAYLGFPWMPPEIREDRGEIEAAIRQSQGMKPGLPDLVEVGDVKGDLHIHTSYDLSSSHDTGEDTLEVCLDQARDLGYEYIGLSDHNPRVTGHTLQDIVRIMKKRKERYLELHERWLKRTGSSGAKGVRIFVMCEVDIQPDGHLALPQEAFDFVDAVIVSVHSSFTQNREDTTNRVLKALRAHPKVRIFGHPTGRLLGKREGIDLDWKKIFAACRERNIALEINSYPDRLDLPDSLVYDAVREGIHCVINTDSHAASHMNLLKYGVAVARRGWAAKRDIVNTLNYNEFASWLLRSKST